MREIVLDTETTGFDPFSGDRIVEIGALELGGHVPTGVKFHEYINPERGMPDEAFQGMDWVMIFYGTSQSSRQLGKSS